jgi:hypothetical protein
MFDFRYHVASLAAVFIALMVGIVIGVGLTGEPLEESERVRLNNLLDDRDRQIDQLQEELEERRAAERFAESAESVVMDNRLAGRRIGVLIIGADTDVRTAITAAVHDADGSVERFKSLRPPADAERVTTMAEDDELRDVGLALGQEFVDGGETPLWDTLESELVLQQDTGDEPLDGVVVVRVGEPYQGEAARFLNGLYAGATGDVPVVWVVRPGEEPARTPTGMLEVDGVTSALGRIELVRLLAGERLDDPIEPVEPPAEAGG